MVERTLPQEETKLYQLIVQEKITGLSKDIVALVSRINTNWKKALKELDELRDLDRPAIAVIEMIPGIQSAPDPIAHAKMWIERMTLLQDQVAVARATMLMDNPEPVSTATVENDEPEGTDDTGDRKGK